jgi:hypothetical protein
LGVLGGGAGSVDLDLGNAKSKVYKVEGKEDKV